MFIAPVYKAQWGGNKTSLIQPIGEGFIIGKRNRNTSPPNQKVIHPEDIIKCWLRVINQTAWKPV